MEKITMTALILTLALTGSVPALTASGRSVETLTPNEAVSEQAVRTAEISEPLQTEVPVEIQQAPTASTVQAPKTSTVQAPTLEQRKITRTYIAEKGQELGNFGDWSLEDKYEYSLWVEAQGIPQDQVVHGLPGEDNMSREEAVQLARETIAEVYSLKETTLDLFNVQVEFNVIDAGNPVWQIYFDVKDNDNFAALGLYRVYINDATGEIIKLEDASSYAIPSSELTTLPDAAG